MLEPQNFAHHRRPNRQHWCPVHHDPDIFSSKVLKKKGPPANDV
jgi:hypothetical protein